MPFVNEYVSEADVKLHDLDALLAKSNKEAWSKGRPAVFRHAWTIDRERNAFVIRLTRAMNYDTPSGIPMPTFEESCLLRWNGIDIGFTLTLVEELRQPVHTFVWSISDIKSAPGNDANAVLELIKDAISVRGKFGAFSNEADHSSTFL